MSAGLARALLSLETPEHIEPRAERIIAEGLSVPSVEELIMLGDLEGDTRERKKRQSKKRSDSLEDLISEMAARVVDQLDTRVTVIGMARINARVALVIGYRGRGRPAQES